MLQNFPSRLKNEMQNKRDVIRIKYDKGLKKKLNTKINRIGLSITTWFYLQRIEI